MMYVRKLERRRNKDEREARRDGEGGGGVDT